MSKKIIKSVTALNEDNSLPKISRIGSDRSKMLAELVLKKRREERSCPDISERRDVRLG